MSSRQREAKKGIKAEDSRRKREDKSIAIRKNKRKEQLLKRRNMASTPAASDVTSAAPAGQVGDLPTIARTIMSAQPADRFAMTQRVRRMLSKEEAPPVQPVIDAGLVPILVQFLKLIQEPKTQFEAAWALTNIASTEHTRIIVTSGALEYLVKLMKSQNADVREQCLWCLGNVAGDGHDMRDMLLSNPASMANLLLNITHAANKSMIKNATWTLSNFCRGKPQPALERIQTAFPILARLIQSDDPEVVGDACWALSYISDGSNDRIQAVVSVGVVPTLVKLLCSDTTGIVTPALRTIGNIVSGNDAQTQAVLDAGVCHSLGQLLKHTKRTVRKEACWTLSNIAAGTPKQVASLLACPSIVKEVMHVLGTDQFDVRKEAAWVISNLCTGGHAAHISKVVELGGIQALVGVLDIDGDNDVKVILVALEALSAILASPSNCGRKYETLVEDHEGLDRLEGLQDHENEEIYNKSVAIITAYFDGGDDDEEDNENIAGDGNSYAFGFSGGKQSATDAGGFGGLSFGSEITNAAPAATTNGGFGGFSF